VPVYKGLELVVAPTDSEHRGYFEEAGRGQLVVQQCTACQTLRASIGAGCSFCSSLHWRWSPVSGRGSIFSFQIVVHPVHPAFRDWVPYPLVLVELDEQRNLPWKAGIEGENVSLRVTTNLVRAEDASVPEAEERVSIGARVKVCFFDLGDGLALPQFCLAEEGGTG
jgi:uncharacterized OB-fold protein